MILKYQSYPNIYKMLMCLDGMSDIQDVMKEICQIILIALTALDLSPGRIKLALLSINKLQTAYSSTQVNSSAILNDNVANNSVNGYLNNNCALDWIKLIHDELLIDFTQEQLYVIDSGLKQSNPYRYINMKGVPSTLNFKPIRDGCNPVDNGLMNELFADYLNNFVVKSSSDQTNILYGIVCSLIEGEINSVAMLEDIIYILALSGLSQVECISELYNMLDDIQVSKILKYKIPI